MSLRIAYVCADPGVPVFGRKGCSIHVQEVLRAFCRLGHRVELFAARIGGEAPRGLSGITVHPLPALKQSDPGLRELEALASNGALEQRLESEGPFDLVYERYSLWSSGAMSWAAGRGIPSVLEVNAPLIEEQARHRSLVNEALARQNAARVFTKASQVAAVSEEVARYVRVCGADASRVHVVPNGVDTERFGQAIRLRTTVGLRQPGFVVGFVGTLKPWHGLENLVTAFALLQEQAPESRLLIVGDGPMRSECEAWIAQRNLSHACRFTGAVASDDMPQWLGQMDVAVAPYPALEGFYFSPLKIYEYMAAGLAVVASDIGQIPGIINHERTGLLCAPGDTEGLATALLGLRNDPQRRDALGRAARDCMIRSHTWDRVAERLLTLAGVECGNLVLVEAP